MERNCEENDKMFERILRAKAPLISITEQVLCILYRGNREGVQVVEHKGKMVVPR